MPGRNLLLRMAFVAVLAIGLVGMHHLVVAACHHGSSLSVVGVSDQHSHEAPHPSPGGDEEPMVELALTCLAVLSLLALVLPGLKGRVRWPVACESAFTAIQRRSDRFADPPDLIVLSISRT